MKRIAIVTDSNSGISQEEAKRLGISVLPMPFTIDGELFFEDLTISKRSSTSGWRPGPLSPPPSLPRGT